MVLIDYQIPKHPGIIFSKILGLGVEFNPGIPGYPRIPLGPGAQIIWARCCPRHAPDDIFIHCGFPQDFPKWSPSSHLSVSYLISSKRLLFENIAHVGSFSVFVFVCKSFFSVTRRSRTDAVHLLSECVMVSIDLTDVTLVCEDAF